MPILTLTTDIGQRDFLVGAIRGQLLQLNPNLTICDITHHLSQTNYPQAAYICGSAFKYFPAGTFHLIIVNLFESSLRHLLVAKFNEQFIICPDNGLLTMITGQKPKEIAAIPADKQKTLLELTQLVAVSVARINQRGGIAGEPKLTDIVEKYPLRPTSGPDWIEGQILFIDNFENVVINITKKEFEEQCNGRRFKIVFKRNEVIETISDNYTAVPETEKLAWFNSAGYLEIALRNGNMAGLFGLQGYNAQMQQSGATADNKWFYQTVRIFFEA